MKYIAALLGIAAALGAASCGGNGETPHEPGAQLVNADGSARGASPGRANAGGSSGSASGQTGRGARNGEDVPPADAQFTLFCQTFRGVGHVQTAQAMKEQLIQVTKRQGWHLLHAEEESTLYFGYYRTIDNVQQDPKEVARAKADLKAIAAITDSTGDKLFKTCVFVPVSDPDPDAPAAWNLANAPADAFWSVQIAAYRGGPERKRLAVDSVREARRMGINNIYYYHGETISSVCIGLWPRSAIKEQDHATARSDASDRPLLVLNDVMPANVSPDIYDRTGKRMVIQAPKLEILDPTLKKVLEKYPDHAINGEVMVKRIKGQEFRDHSFIVMVPHNADVPTGSSEGIAADHPTGSTGADAAAGALLDDSHSSRPGYGKLRSIGDQ